MYMYMYNTYVTHKKFFYIYILTLWKANIGMAVWAIKKKESYTHMYMYMYINLNIRSLFWYSNLFFASGCLFNVCACTEIEQVKIYSIGQ